MEANGLSKIGLPSSYLGCGVFTGATKVDEAMTDAATPDRVGGSAILSTIHTALDTTAVPIVATITPTSSRENSFHNHGDDFGNLVASSFVSCGTDESSTVLKGVCDNVSFAQARIQDIEDRIANCSKSGNHQLQGIGDTNSPQQINSLALLQNHLFTQKVCLIDALVIMGWEHYRCFLAESSSFEKAEAAVRHIYEEALDISIQLFCSSPTASSNSAINNERLMILLLVLDFDEYCETLLEYQLTREYISAHPPSKTNGADTASGIGSDQATHRRMGEMLNSARKGENYLQQLHELWKSGRFDRFDPTASEEEDRFAKIHAAGMCLVLLRKLESQVDRQQTDLNTMERQFRYLFDDYLPRQLTQPSMNNIISTKYARVLFQDGTPTVYWSLLADSYRKEWG